MRKTINKEKKRIQYPLFFILFLAIAGCFLYYYTIPEGSIRVIPYEVPDGWGYKIKFKEKIFVTQPFIPVIPGSKPFPSKKTALKAGRIVKNRIISREAPGLTKKDLVEIGIDSLGNAK